MLFMCAVLEQFYYHGHLSSLSHMTDDEDDVGFSVVRVREVWIPMTPILARHGAPSHVSSPP